MAVVVRGVAERIAQRAGLDESDFDVVDVEVCLGVVIGDPEAEPGVARDEGRQVDGLAEDELRRVKRANDLVLVVLVTFVRDFENELGARVDIEQAIVERKDGGRRIREVDASCDRVVDAATRIELDATARGIGAVVVFDLDAALRGGIFGVAGVAAFDPFVFLPVLRAVGIVVSARVELVTIGATRALEREREVDVRRNVEVRVRRDARVEHGNADARADGEGIHRSGRWQPGRLTSRDRC